jgi:Abortive infection alpha
LAKPPRSVSAAVGELLLRLFGPTADDVGPIMANWVTSFRLGNLKSVVNLWKVRTAVEGKPKADTKYLPPGIGMRVIEAASKEDDPDVQKMWADLLFAALSSEQEIEITKAHVEILGSLSGLEALIMEFLWRRQLENDIDPSSLNSGPHADFLDKHLKPRSVRDRATAIQNLMRLQCVKRIYDTYYAETIMRGDSWAPEPTWDSGRSDRQNILARFEAVERLLRHTSGELDMTYLGLDPEIEEPEGWVPEIGFQLSVLGADLMQICRK